MKSKTILFVILALLLFAPHAKPDLTYDADYYKNHIQEARTGGSYDPIRLFMTEVATKLFPASGTGSIFYVDSGVSSAGAGTSWTTAVATLQEGIDLCTANNGDFVYVAQGHAENIASGAAIDADCAGITIVGFGAGDDMPEFSLTAQASTFQISAADVTIYNVRFLGAYSGGTTNGVDVTADGDGFQIIGCEFKETSNTQELLTMLTVTADADRGVIAYNRFIGTNSADNTDCIDLEGGSDKTVIQGNTFIGTWSDCVIDGTANLSTGLMIVDNRIVNLDTTAGKTIQCHASTNGAIIGNCCYANGAGFALVGNAMFISPDNIVMQTENVAGRNFESMIGAYTGPVSGAAADDNIKAHLDLVYTDSQAILTDTGTTLVAQINAARVDINDIETDTAAWDTSAEARTLLFGSDTAGATASAVSSIASTIAALSDTGYVGSCEVNAGGAAVVTCASLAGFGDDYFNTGWSLKCILDYSGAGSAPEGEVIDIVDYVSDTGVFTVNYNFSSALTTGDGIMILRTEELNLDDNAMLGSSGEVLYVDSGTSGDGSGLTMENAYATLTLALDGATESTDTIIVSSGHAETISAAYAIDDIGVRIVGLGKGMLRPTFTFDTSAANANLDVSVANVTFENLIFTADLADLAACFDVATGGDGLVIKDCLFTSTATNKEFLCAIDLTTGADDILVENCTFLAVGTDADYGINAIAGATDNLRVIDCVFYGDYDNGCIYSDQATTNWHIEGNILHQETTGVRALDLGDTATGTIANNLMYSDSYATILDPGACICINNWATDAADQQAIRIPLSAETSDVTEVADGSDLERLEFLQNEAEDILTAMGIDSASANIFYVDSSCGAADSGTTWADAEVTLKAAIDDATDNTGAIIFVAANHAENIAGATAINCPGVKIIGLGVGESRPKLTFTAEASALAHTVADVMYKNIIFICSTQDSTVAVSLDGSSDGAVFEDCEWRNTTTNEFIDTVTLAAACDNVRFTRCKFLNNTAAGGNISAINSTAGVTNNLIIEDCYFYGAFTTAAIESTQIEVDLKIRNNTIYNTSTGDYAIKLSAAALGTLSGNKCYADTWGTVIDPGSLQCFNNYVSNYIDQTGTLFPTQPQKIDSVHGTGRVIYVDSGATAGGGGTWETALNTIDAAMDLCVADRGDTIYVAQGHVEVEAGAASIFTADVEGVSIIGISNGACQGAIAAGAVTGTDSQMPVFILDNASATATVSAANVTLKGLRFESDIADCAIGVTVANTGDGAVIDGCYFRDGAADEELVVGISIAADADNCQVRNCYFSTFPAGGCANAILLAGGCDDGIFENNVANGTYSAGAFLATAAASRNLTLRNNIFCNQGAIAVDLNATTTGIMANNYLAGTTSIAAALTDVDAMWLFENYVSGEDNKSGLLDPAADGD